MVTEKVNRTRHGYTPDRPFGVNAGVTMALSHQLAGDCENATKIMRTIASWWNASSLCIMEPAAVHDGFCYTRALAYFLFGTRALRLPSLLPQADMEKIDAQLWRTQAVNCSSDCGGGKALSSTYYFGGAPMLRNGAHSSTEPANLALLAYDPRIQTEWFPQAAAAAAAAAEVEAAEARAGVAAAEGASGGLPTGWKGLGMCPKFHCGDASTLNVSWF
jgi:hypothetical protein